MTDSVEDNSIESVADEVYSDLEGMTADEREKLFWQAVTETRRRHLRFGGRVGRFHSFKVDVPHIELGLWGVVLSVSSDDVLYLEAPDEGESTSGGIYQFVIDEESVRNTLENATVDDGTDEDGVRVRFKDAIESMEGKIGSAGVGEVHAIKGTVEIRGGFEPLIIKPAADISNVDEKQLTIVDILAWLEIADALAAGDERQAATILHLAYSTFDAGKQKAPGRYVRTKGVTRVMDISPAVNAVFNPTSRHYLQPQDYFSGDGVAVPVGEAGRLEIGLRAPADADISTFSPTDRLAEHERYWLDMVNTRALQGEGVIHGSDLLKSAGCRNPYSRTMAGTMAEAAEDILKLTRYGAFIDVTGERMPKSRNKHRLISSLQYRPIIDAEFYINRYADGSDEVRDFEIRLRNQDEPIKSLPFFDYSATTGRYIEAGEFPACFKGMRIQQDHRYMWHHVERQLKTKGLTHGNTILFSTMFEALQLDGTDRNAQKKRQRMLDMLEKMLRRAAGGHRVGGSLEYEPIIKSWRYKTEAGRRVGITITPLEDVEDE